MRHSLRRTRPGAAARAPLSAPLSAPTPLGAISSAELRAAIRSGVHEFLRSSAIPLAAVDIRLQADCRQCGADSLRPDFPRTIRFNISSSRLLGNASQFKSSGTITEPVKPKHDDNTHWMTWTDPTPFFTKQSDLKTYRLQTAQTSLQPEHRCASPFVKPVTAAHQHPEVRESSPPPPRPCSRDSLNKCEYSRPARPATRLEKKTSVAVGPDKHFETAGTNTRQSYQISDYLKKSMNLNDPYERKVFSSVMEVLRKKNRREDSVDTESIAADPVIQLSEYKSKFRNPQNKVFSFPTKNTSNTLIHKRPHSCLDKVRPLGQLRPRSSTLPRFQLGEQYLY